MLIQSDVTIKQSRRPVNPLPGRLVFYGDNVPVAVGLNACVRQAPFQNGVVVVNNPVRLQVRA